MNQKIKNLIIFITIVVVMILGFKYFPIEKSKEISAPSVTKSEQKDKAPVSITEEDINEQNFTGKRSKVAGDNLIVKEVNDFIEKEISDFKERADVEVPDMRAEFGADSSTVNYLLYLEAKHIKGEKTESIVISEYAYTGGANGMGTYKVFTNSLKDDKTLSLKGIIKEDQQSSFVSYIKQKLINYRPEGMEGGLPVVFPEEVETLTIDSFRNWSMDSENLNIYFDKYEIGPGVLGAMALSLPLIELQNFLTDF